MTLAAIGLLTTAETRTLIAKLLFNVTAHPAFIWAWSRWRRYHQALAAICHRKRRHHMKL